MKQEHASSSNKDSLNRKLLNGFLDTIRKHPALTAALIPLLAATFLPSNYTDKNVARAAVEMWGQTNSATIQNGTVPEPTPTPEVTPPAEEEPLPTGNFNTIVRTYDSEGNTTSGVVVAFINSAPNDNILGKDFDFLNSSYGIAPMFDDDRGISNPQQFPPSGEQAIIIGEKAEEFWQDLIDLAIAEGRTGDAEWMQTYYPAIQPLENASILINNNRSAEGENLLAVNAQFSIDQNGERTAAFGYEYPSYRDQSPNSLQEIGVDYGLLEPLASTLAPPSYTDGISITFTGGEEPRLSVASQEETIEISTPPLVRASISYTEHVNSQIDKLEISAVDELMLNRQAYFEELVNATGGNPENLVRIAAMSEEIPIELPEGDRRIAVIIKGTDLVTTDGTTSARFNLGPDSTRTLEAILTDIRRTDIVKLKVVGEKIVAENLGPNDHMPTITVIGEPASRQELFVPFVSSKK